MPGARMKLMKTDELRYPGSRQRELRALCEAMA